MRTFRLIKARNIQSAVTFGTTAELVEVPRPLCCVFETFALFFEAKLRFSVSFVLRVHVQVLVMQWENLPPFLSDITHTLTHKRTQTVSSPFLSLSHTHTIPSFFSRPFLSYVLILLSPHCHFPPSPWLLLWLPFLASFILFNFEPIDFLKNTQKMP